MGATLTTVLIITLAFSSAFIAVNLQTSPAHAWWQKGHYIVASRAVGFLPEPWSNFFGYYGLLVNESSYFPDGVFKELDPNEDPRHFIDLEVWNPNKPDTGTLPFAVEQYTADMTQAIKTGDWNRMFIDAGRMAHYVADIHQPYHSTVNYNPSNKAGASLHSLLDSSMETHVNEFKLIRPADIGTLQTVRNLTAFMIYIARQSNAFLTTINHTLIDAGKSWSPELTRIIENRTNTAIVSLARVWYTAILNSGLQPPTISTPNRLTIKIETSPQQIDPEKSYSVPFTVSDGLGVWTILHPQAAVDSTSVNVFADQGLVMPYGKYVAVIPRDVLRQYSGRSLTLNLVAELAGHERATAQLQIQVAQTQTVTPQPPQQPSPAPTTLIPLVVAIVIVVTVLVFVARQRTRKH